MIELRVHVKNLGAIKQADFELGDMTIICGKNNTGKTYATYALFGFLSFWREAFSLRLDSKIIKKLMQDGFIELRIDDLSRQVNEVLADASREYTEKLPVVFASAEKHFETTSFLLTVEPGEIRPVDSFERIMGTTKQQIISINKLEEDIISVSLLVDKGNEINMERSIIHAIGEAIKEIIYGSLLPKPFIASAERTGAAIFRKELNFARNRLLEQMSSMKTELNAFELLNRVYSDYAMPVRSNVDFTRQLEDVAKRSSFISRQHPQILTDFQDIIGGEYKVIRDELFYVPAQNKKLRLTMDESSSAVRSLLDLGFYLRHVIEPGDLLMIDEPELNLHPENQRRIARLLARLVNLGIKVFVTTHSDYIVKEINTLIMLNQDKPYLEKIRSQEGYKPEELLSTQRIKVYIAEEESIKLDGNTRRTKCNTLVPADINSEFGIEARSFDDTIYDMNRIQDLIVFGGEESEWLT